MSKQIVGSTVNWSYRESWPCVTLGTCGNGCKIHLYSSSSGILVMIGMYISQHNFGQAKGDSRRESIGILVYSYVFKISRMELRHYLRNSDAPTPYSLPVLHNVLPVQLLIRRLSTARG